MKMDSQRSAVLRIELWHGLFLLTLWVFFVPLRVLELRSLLLGGLFMGLNFLLLSCGLGWLLALLSGKGRVRAGIFLLLLKSVLFLGLISALFFRVQLDTPSFAAGVSCLLVAIIVETLWDTPWVGE